MKARKNGGGGPAPGTQYKKLTPLIDGYDERHVRLVRSLCLLGAIDSEMVDAFGMVDRTLLQYAPATS